MKTTYRPDIDGLRAIAVSGVLLYHLDHNLCPGGFTGVDIFFVISGYLITSIISREIKAKEFSLTRFYERRIRRILPAYFFLLLFTTTLGYLLLTPEPMEQYGKAMSNSLVFLSNFLFAGHVDYFEKTFESSPLLHMWSLSVEEQFYLLWPLTIMLLAKYCPNRRLSYFFLVFLGGSLLASELLTVYAPKSAFFMIYSRAWELGAGALIALPVLPGLSSPKKVEVLSVIGMILILVSLIYVNDTLRFPGLSATFAVIGTALIIYSGKSGVQGFVHRFLSLKIIVFAGLISYSLYLWHWPVIAYAKNYLGRDLASGEMVVVAFVSMVAAYASYKWVETPFRRREQPAPLTPFAMRYRFVQRPFKGALIVTIVLLATSIAISDDGLSFRFSHLSQTDLYSKNPFRDECHVSSTSSDLPSSAQCTYDFGDKKVLLWGDSHADHYMPALKGWAEKSDMQLRQISKSACPPVVGEFSMYRLSDGVIKEYETCLSSNENVIATVHDEKMEIVVLAGRWATYFANSGTGTPGAYFLDSEGVNPDSKLTERIFTKNFTEMVVKLTENDRKVIILGQMPAFPEHPPECYLAEETPFKRFVNKDIGQFADDCSLAVETIERPLVRSRTFFEQLSSRDNVFFFDPVPYLCNDSSCEAKQNEKILYRDNNHLNLVGAEYFSSILVEILPAIDSL